MYNDVSTITFAQNLIVVKKQTMADSMADGETVAALQDVISPGGNQSAWCMRMNEFDEELQKERFVHKFCLEYNERVA